MKKQENTHSSGQQSLKKALFAMGFIAMSAGLYVAWPALVHIGGKLA